MSEPNWVALGGGGVDYVGGWAAGTAYRAGDVVRHNGIEYLAVNPSTGQTPAPAAPLLTGTELAYAERTSNLTVNATTEAAALSVVAAPAITVDGITPIVIEAAIPTAQLGVHTAANFLIFCLFDGETSLGKLGDIGWSIAPGNYYEVPMRMARRLTPSAGTHTYSIRAFRTGADGLVVAGAGGVGNYVPAFIRVLTSQPTAVAVRTFTAPGIGTTLPASPVDGDEYILVDSLTAPTYQWHFRYMASVTDAYKWVLVGGPPAFDERQPGGAVETTTSVTYVALTTPGPSIVVPRAGIFLVEFGFFGWNASGSSNLLVSYDIGATAAVDADATRYLTVDAGVAQPRYYSRSGRKTLTAPVTLTMKYRVPTGTGNFYDRWMRVTPVRVA